MGNGSINHEQCNIREELSVQVQAALAAITMEFIDGMAESYSTRLCVDLIRRGQCRNGRRDILRDLCRGMQTSEGIACAQEAQAEALERSLRGGENS
jgi:hypothetical protein